MTVTDTANDLRTRASEAAEVSRARAEDLSAVARARTEDLSAAARERAERLADSAEPHVRDVAARASAARDALPDVVERLLEGLTGALGFLSEGGRALASRVEPPAAERRRGRMRTAAWFTGGLVVGAAGGWIAHARMHHEPQPPYDASQAPQLPLRRAAAGDSPYGDEAVAIDARRENVGLN